MRGDPFMAIYMVKCPACDSATELNDEKDFGFCTECGTKILTAEAELFVPEENAAAPALSAEETPAAADAAAETLSVPAPAAEPETEVSLPVPAMVYDGPRLSNTEHLEYLILHQPQPLDSVVFHNSDECAAYVTSLHDLILELGARYEQMNHAEEATCLDYLDRGIAYCEYLDTRRLRFLAGTHEEKGRMVEDYGTYPVSKTLLKEIKAVREHFVASYNGFFQPKIAATKAALEESREKIRNLPAFTRFSRSFCTPLMGILTAVLVVIGILAVTRTGGGWNLVNTAILIVGALLFLAWAILTVRWIFTGAAARQLYKAADRQIGEVRTYRAKLKS